MASVSKIIHKLSDCTTPPDIVTFSSDTRHITSEKFFIEPRDTGISELLVIDRVSQDISIEAHQGQVPPHAITKNICGIFGVIRLTAGPYLIVITKKNKVGEINGQTIWKVLDTEIHSYKRTMLHLTEQQITTNKIYLSMVESVMKREHYYFSMTFDLSHSLQRLHNTSPDFLAMPLHERADQRFVWNGHVLRELAQQPELSRYCLPIIHGFVTIKSCSINNKLFDYALISRRCVFRAGTRFFMRGLDGEGQAANYVETEQLVQYMGHSCSHVQTRGSIPLFWSQRPNLKYKPTPIINDANHMDGFQRHFNTQIFIYGKQVIINLIDHKGVEDLLEKALAQTVINSQNKGIRYESFDFHHECRKMNFDRLSILMEKVADDLKKFSYFMVTRDGMVNSQQEGVFRTNCMDCLDRTNVVQSLIATDMLNQQLQKFEILEKGQSFLQHKAFDVIFKNVWADNADICSVQYAGTYALKTDFTRTGKRTQIGLVMDGVNSLMRYFKNNFSDGFRQDSVDLFLGNYIVEENEGISHTSPLNNDKDWKFYALPVIFLIAFSMCVISILLPDEHLSEQVMYIFFWGIASLVSLSAVYFYGAEFVDKPRLAKFKIE